MKPHRGLVGVKDAADLLGVKPMTLKRWESLGKLKSRRHPVNNFRLYRQKDIERLKSKIEPKPVLMTIEKAAILLGVSMPTLRRWDRAGKFTSYRHPMNGYRLYARAELEQLRKVRRRAA